MSREESCHVASARRAGQPSLATAPRQQLCLFSTPSRAAALDRPRAGIAAPCSSQPASDANRHGLPGCMGRRYGPECMGRVALSRAARPFRFAAFLRLHASLRATARLCSRLLTNPGLHVWPHATLDGAVPCVRTFHRPHVPRLSELSRLSGQHHTTYHSTLGAAPGQHHTIYHTTLGDLPGLLLAGVDRRGNRAPPSRLCPLYHIDLYHDRSFSRWYGLPFACLRLMSPTTTW